MTIEALLSRLDLEKLVAADPEREILAGYTSDLMSDVMANAAEGSVLITIQAHKNSVAVAALAGIAAIIVCSARPVPDDMIQASESEGIGLYRSTQNQFTVSGRVFALLGGAA